MSTAYRRLQQRLDELPVPFPASETGSEIRLLKALFSEREAEVAVHLSAVPEPVETVARRVIDIVSHQQTLSTMLEALAERGAINSTVRRRRGRHVTCYGLAPLVVGMFEFQVDKLTPEFVRDFHDYSDHEFQGAVVGAPTPQLRTVPVGAAISGTRAVGSYDDIRAYIRNSPGPFAVMNCVCRQSAELMGEACTTSSTHETCLTVGSAAASTVTGGASRRISRGEVIEILDRAELEGHVLQPQNSQEPAFICCCCRDCCEVLRNARKLPRPSDAIPTTHRAVVDSGACIACGACVRRCPMDAVELDKDAAQTAAQVMEERCIGCGVCVTRCPTDAIYLARRDDVRKPPKTTDAMYLKMFRDRFGLLGLARAGVRQLLHRKV
ncbi:MAG: ATP-binding protein [Spirochaetota bacterium]